MRDLLHDDAFSVASLTQLINDLTFQPGRISQMGLFETERINTTVALIERQDGLLRIVSPTPRGGPGVTLPKTGRNIRPLLVPHFEINDAVNADEVQNVRAAGTEDQLETVLTKVAQRQQIHADSMAVTEEHARMGAIKGIVTYAPREDGIPSEPQLNLYNEFGVTKPDVILFDFGGTATDGALLRLAQSITRQIGNALGGAVFQRVHAFVGDEFFDSLLTSKEVRESYKGTPQARVLRDGKVEAGSSWGMFEFGGIIFENYRGQVGTAAFIEPDEARFFPVGAPGVFRSIYAPADYAETVNTPGERLYTKQWTTPNGKRIELETQMNALQLCTRPEVLIEGRLVPIEP